LVNFIDIEDFDSAKKILSGNLDDVFIDKDDWNEEKVEKKKKYIEELKRKNYKREIWELKNKRKIKKYQQSGELSIVEKLSKNIKESKIIRENREKEFEKEKVKPDKEQLNNHIFFLFAHQPKKLEFLFKNIKYNDIIKYGLLNSVGKAVGYFTCELKVENNFFVNFLIETFNNEETKIIICMMLRFIEYHNFLDLLEIDNIYTFNLLFSPGFPTHYDDITKHPDFIAVDNTSYTWMKKAKNQIIKESYEFDSSEDLSDEDDNSPKPRFDDFSYIKYLLENNPENIRGLKMIKIYTDVINIRKIKVLLLCTYYSKSKNIIQILPPDVFKLIFSFL
jgi:hypothetical protein